MAREIRGAIEGLAKLLQAINGLRVYTHWVEPTQFPAAVVLFTGRNAEPEVGMGDSDHFTGQVTVTLFVASGSTEEAYELLEEMMEPRGTRSIQEAADADVTWGGTVDDGRLIEIAGVGLRQYPSGAMYLSADFRFRFLKAVP